MRVQCVECGKIEFVSPYRYKNYKCCSVECLSKHNSKKYNKQVVLKCPICGKEYKCKQSKIEHHRTCGDSNCRTQWLRQTIKGKNNSNYRRVEIELMKHSVSKEIHGKSKTIYQHVVKEVLELPSTSKLPKGMLFTIKMLII